MLSFKLQDTNDQVWKSATKLWKNLAHEDTYNKLKSTSKAIDAFYKWNLNVLKMYHLSKNEKGTNGKQ